ncbi:MAG: YHS domain-containing protein [Desulfobaccales bacterium]|jgi:YHS domain-containing protein
MKMLKILAVSLVVLALAAGPVLAAGSQPQPQTVCPVLGGNIDKKVYVDYQGKRIYFCCPGCPAEFQKDPEKYLKKMEAQGITLEKCPETQQAK